MHSTIEWHSVSQLRDELSEGLRIYVETAWGWTEVKAAAFLKQVGDGQRVAAYCEVRKNGAVTLKIPRRI